MEFGGAVANGSNKNAGRAAVKAKSRAMSTQSQRSFTIRRADSNDGEAIVACLAAAFAPYCNSYTPGAFTDTVLDSRLVQHRLRELCVFVAVSEGNVVGTLAWAVSGEEGHLRGMAVLPGWQGSGVASALLQAAEAEIRNQRCKRVTLDTTEPLARAMRFYARHGFTRSGRVSDFFGMPLHEWVKFL
jgi:N-acetylglutamate synthase-like GNAT family acetyltransferase